MYRFLLAVALALVIWVVLAGLAALLGLLSCPNGCPDRAGAAEPFRGHPS